MKSYFVFLSRNKGYTLINFFGLSVSLMFVMLIGLYTWQEKSIDKQVANADRIEALGMSLMAPMLVRVSTTMWERSCASTIQR